MPMLRNAAHLSFWLTLAGVVSAEATVVTFEATPVFGNTWEYSYAVDNDDLGIDIEELAVYFDVGLFENLRAPGAPAGWDPIVVEPDGLLLDDGFYDVLALAGGILPGGTLGGFTVWADFLGAGAPGAQRFEVRDPLSFDLLDAGFTTRAGGPVSEPASVLVLACGACGFLAAGGLARFRRAR